MPNTSRPFGFVSQLTRFGLLSLMMSQLLAATPPEFQLMKAEKLGPLQLGIAANKLPAWPGCKVKLGPTVMWGADGLYHQDWDYPTCGIKLGMVSNTATSAKSVESITITAPSKFVTQKGIHIGNTAQEALKAYGNAYNKADSMPGESLVFGSVYGGLILFIEKGKIVRMFLGAAAE